eukprot:NODE_469_length_2716_cov_26.061319_g402_i0.p1 GENE.NODE_469_length_2716_cov_26.061319_g402_i0~~NODE_469_length_2716_cov_26.061319_g402_i0.p1  ORF type:complete len:419 (+),score=35.48 NODE_469_length_2716_cov_26.061319_g402_i0:1356-2612(+)
MSQSLLNDLPVFVNTSLPELKELIWSHSSLKYIPSGLDYLHDLMSLDLSYNNISNVDGNWLYFPKLVFLNMSHNDIPDLNDMVSQSNQKVDLFSNISVIDLSYCKLNNVPFLGKSKLKLLGNNITHWDWLGHLVDEVPIDIIRQVPNLEVFSISGGITELPLEFFELEKINDITIAISNIKELPDLFYRFPDLFKMEIYGSTITKIPPSLITLPKLQYVQLYGNKQLSDISILQNTTSPLLSVVLSSCSILTLPDIFVNMKDLVRFEISDNQISTLPSSLYKLPNLKFLKLDGNKLEYVPMSLLPKSLIYVSLLNNPFSLDIDSWNELKTLSNMQVITISSNINLDISMSPSLRVIVVPLNTSCSNSREDQCKLVKTGYGIRCDTDTMKCCWSQSEKKSLSKVGECYVFLGSIDISFS